MTTVGALLAEAKHRLAKTSFSPSLREASLILGHLMEWSEAQVLSRDHCEVSSETTSRFEDYLEQRLQGRPIAYLLGHKEFWGRTFRVDDRVLIPRPETEHLVERALALTHSGTSAILDLGTGSGCLGITLALERPQTRVTAVDQSISALAVAQGNARRLKARNVDFLGGDWTQSLRLASFELIVANPPYIDDDAETLISPEITQFEPREALFAPEQGMGAYRLLLQSLGSLPPQTPCLFEIGADQGPLIRELAASIGWRVLCIHQDLAGRDRVAELHSSHLSPRGKD